MSTVTDIGVEGLIWTYLPLKASLCAVRRDDSDQLLWIARDLFDALGVLDRAELAEFRAQPVHETPIARHHAECMAYTLEVIAPSIRSWAPADVAEPLIARLEYWSGERRRDPARRAWEMAEAARILDADPNIETGFYALRGWMHAAGWLELHGDVYTPAEFVTAKRLLSVRKDRVPGRAELYPTVLVTERGIRALHERLGGVAPLNLDHQHPLLPGLGAHR